MNLRVTPRITFAVLLIVIGSVAFANVVGVFFRYVLGHPRVLGLVPLFDMDTEGNVPTFIAALMLMFAAVLLFITAWYYRGRAGGKYWFGLGLIFAFLSFDEASAIHELFAVPLQAALNTSGYLYGAWIIPYSLLLILFAAAYFRFWLRLPAQTRWLFALSGIVYIFATVGMDSIGARIVDNHGGFGAGMDHINHVIIYSIEEPLEMFGIALFIYAILDHLSAIGSPDPIHITISR